MEITAERFTENHAFQELITVATQFAAAHASVVTDMNLQQRRAYADKANALSAEVKSGAASRRREATFADLGALVGITESDAHALMSRAQNAGKEFAAAFPEFATTDEQTKLDALMLAIRRHPAVIDAARRLVSPAQPDTAADISPQECEASCRVFFAIFLTAGIAMFIAGIAGCVFLGWIPPLMILCMVAAAAIFAAYLVILNEIYQSCLDNCQEDGPGQPD